MIDEKRLDGILAAGTAPKRWDYWKSDRPESNDCAPVCPEEFLDIVRLAKLGLWADKEGIPALLTNTSEREDKLRTINERIDSLAADFAALPKEKA